MNKKISKKVIAMILLAVIVVAAGLFAYSNVMINQTSQEKEAIKKAVLSSAVQCCAIEGNYPQSLDYLKDSYGLQIDESKYIVVYEVIGSNVLPEVTVLEKGK